MRTVILLSCIILGMLSLASPGGSAIIAQCTVESNVGSCTSTTWTHAEAFTVLAAATATEVQLRLWRSGGTTGTFTMSLYADVNGYPGGTALASVSKAVSAISTAYPPTWVSFKWGGSSLSIGTYWIVCKVSADCNAEITCGGTATNACGTGRDAMTSFDGGATWPVLQTSDINYIVYGDRTPVNTNTTVIVDPGGITAGGGSMVTVSVRAAGNLIPGQGTVSLIASNGSLGSASPPLLDGQASTTYTAPMAAGNFTVTATYAGHSYGGNDYQGSIGVGPVVVSNQNRPTSITQVLGAGSAFTRGHVNVNVTVRDVGLALVPCGKVTFECTGGTFAPNPATIVNGVTATTFTAGLIAGNFNVKADFSGCTQGGVVYGPKTDIDPIIINLTPVNTFTTLTVSPDPCYINKSTFTKAIVTQGGVTPVPGGSVQFTAPFGGFDNVLVPTANGIAWTKWTAPGTTGNVNLTATYQQYDVNGYRYLPSGSNHSEAVNKDPDNSHPNLNYLLEWNTNYSDAPLDDCGIESEAFGQKLAGIGWSGEEWANGDAWEKDMKADWWFHSGNENDYVDSNDITWYSGHGNGDFITFINDHDDKYLRHDDVYDVWGAGNWGDKDAEWMCLSACLVMTKDSYWASTMDGLHCICGFITVSSDQQKLGKAFAGLCIKDSVDDSPYTISQAWFLAGDMSQPQRKKMRVIGQTDACLDDYLWGYGTVAGDPADDATYSYVDHEVVNLNPPTADAGGPYFAKVGTPVNLNGSGSVEPDAESALWYGWDMDTSDNTDNKDWDFDGVNEADDDVDVWGCWAQYTYPTTGVYNIRLLAIDDRLKIDDDTSTVTVTVSSPAPKGPQGIVSEGSGPEIVDDYPALPPEVNMPLFRSNTNILGFNETSTIQQRFGMGGSSRVDDLGNWVMTNGQNQTIVNDYTGAVMYTDMAKSYRFTGPPPGLPNPAQIFPLADMFLLSMGIQHDGSVYDQVTDISYGSVTESSRTTPARLPFQRRANYARTLDVDGTAYPVVGPGGRIFLVFDQAVNPYEPVQYMKVWRDVSKAETVPLYTASQALADFHRLGTAALIYDSKIPICERIEIKNIYVAYYEKDFTTPQSVLYPVYALDLRCFTDNSSFQAQAYLSAMASPIEVSISSPTEGLEIEYNSPVHLEGSVVGGQSPYSYAWYSDIDGLLASTSSADVVLSGSQKSGEVRTHTITLRVTDQNGMVGEKSVTVKVIPNEPSDAIRKPDGTPVWLHDQVVIGCLNDRYYIEEEDRSSGIAVAPTITVAEGDIVSVQGVIQTLEGERILTAPQCTVLSSANPLPEPVLMKSPSLGGSYIIPFPMGVTDAADVYNLGLLVEMTGQVKQVGGDYIYVDDGGALKDGTFTGDEENVGVRVMCNSPQFVVGQYVMVTGISSSFEALPGIYARRILTRRAVDVIVVGP